MTTATKRSGARGGAVRWSWAAVVALVAALAVLVHHDTTATAMPSPAMNPMSAMAGMEHMSAAGMQPGASAGHCTAVKAATPATDHGDGACSGQAMQHCSSGNVSTAQHLAPPALSGVASGDTPHGTFVGHGRAGASHRAPPDLSVLSRLLI